MKQGMQVAGSVQESLWKINGKEQVSCANCLVYTFFFFFPQLGIKKKKYMPYNHQHKYFFISEYLNSPGCTSDMENLSRTKVS